MNRRDFLRSAGLATVVSTSMSEGIHQTLASFPQGTLTNSLHKRNPVSHVISRITYGVTPALYGSVHNIGAEAFIEQQLSPESIDDRQVDSFLSEVDILWQSASEIYANYRNTRAPVIEALLGSSFLRALYSQRQLYERMVQFWSDHFNVYINKGPVLYLKVVEDRDVIRPHAMGKFGDILKTSAMSPAMLVYLDNARNIKGTPNENYARELMELHTLGVGGGYTEQDVVEVARCFTGWTVNARDFGQGEPGQFVFRPEWHDEGEKIVLGHRIPAGGGMEDGERVLEILASHPATATFISHKLIRRFVADEPPESLVERCAQTFLETEGDIKSILHTIFSSDEFWDAPPKFKRPFEYVVGVLRALDVQIRDERGFGRAVFDVLNTLGQVPFNWAAPDGYPDIASYWMSNLLDRWNVAIATVSQQRIFLPNYNAIFNLFDDRPILGLAEYLYGRSLSSDEATVLQDFYRALPGGESEKGLGTIALLLAAPANQYR